MTDSNAMVWTSSALGLTMSPLQFRGGNRKQPRNHMSTCRACDHWLCPKWSFPQGSISTHPTRHYQHSKGQTMVPLSGDFTLLWMRSVLKWKLWTLWPTFAHRAALPFRHVVSLTVQLPTLSCEADGDASLAPTEPTVVHSEHVSVVILHTVEYTGWLCFCRVKTNKACGRGHISRGPAHG